jgi:prepilin-type N-terminal cleavage/methylation domain-containing protein
MKSNKGFTLIEVIITLAIILILFAMILPILTRNSNSNIEKDYTPKVIMQSMQSMNSMTRIIDCELNVICYRANQGIDCFSQEQIDTDIIRRYCEKEFARKEEDH